MSDIAAAPSQTPMLHDCVIQRSKQAARARVEPVPPEEFGVSRFTRRLSECNYAYHQPYRTVGDMLAQGFDPVQIKDLPSFSPITSVEEIDRDTVNENQAAGADGGNEMGRQIKVVEHYCRFDYEGNGEAKLYKITTGGDDGQILRKKTPVKGKDGDEEHEVMKEDIEEFDLMPFAAMTPVIITHRFFGRSIADLVIEIQKIKTALIRGALDNTYLRNNPRPEVAEQYATPETLDDLLVARIGSPIRVRQPGGINWQETPDVTSTTLPVLEYMDQAREMRTGVTRAGQGIDADALQNQSATAVSKVYSASQARVKLIARIFAETGIKDLFVLLHGMIRKHGQEAQTVRLRKQWVQIDPRDWKTRNDLTVHVGLGDGSKAEQIASLTAIGNMQKEMLLGGKSNLVSDANLYNTGKQMVKLVGLKDASLYFTDPATVPPPQPPANPDMIKAQAAMRQMQAKARLDRQKSEQDTEHQVAKTQADIVLAQKKHDLDLEMKQFDARLKLKEAERQHQYKIAELALQESHHQQEREDTGAQQHAKMITEAVGKLGEHLTALHGQHAQVLASALGHALAPKQRNIVRDEHGRATGVVEVPMQ